MKLPVVLLMLIILSGFYSCYTGRTRIEKRENEIKEYRSDNSYYERIVLNNSTGEGFMTLSCDSFPYDVFAKGEWWIDGDTLIFHTLPDSCLITLITPGYIHNGYFKFVKTKYGLVYAEKCFSLYETRSASMSDSLLFRRCVGLEKQGISDTVRTISEIIPSDGNPNGSGPVSEFIGEAGYIYLDDIEKRYHLVLLQSYDNVIAEGKWYRNGDTIFLAISDKLVKSRHLHDLFIAPDRHEVPITSTDSGLYLDSDFFRLYDRREFTRNDSLMFPDL